MNNNNSSKQILLSVLGVAILVVAVVGISFAAFSYSKTGEVSNTITTGTITMTYTEPTNGISLTDALPITDDAGKALKGDGKTFDFTVGATVAGTTTINYAITAVKDATSDLPDTGVKVYLTSTSGETETAVLGPKLVSQLDKTVAGNDAGAPADQYVLKTGTYTATGTDNYRLRMWVDSNYGQQTGNANTTEFAAQHKYILKVNVYGAAKAQ
ncbi:MAG: hypothetical protein LKJ84_00970 [Bacilli bacterium]|jgi:hypothetical protein|nr:hypothetical protein [Bacilli bacterium]